MRRLWERAKGLRRFGYQGVVAGVALLALLVGAGTVAISHIHLHFGGGHATQRAEAAPVVPVVVAISPKSGSRNQPVSTEIGLRASGGTVSGVSVTRKGSAAPLKGAFRDDGSSWVPAAPLAYSSTYTATVTATSPDGKRSQTSSTTFSTMGQPGQQTSTGLYVEDGQTYGVAMPIVVSFDPPVSDGARAAVQRRLFVTSNPPQPGVWHWSAGNQVFYRPPAYWRTGTTITVRAALAGVPMGDGNYGDSDHTATAHIGAKVYLDVENYTKQMRVYVRDKLVRTIPVSLGKPSTPSSSGNLVVMTHEYTTLFDTTREGPGGYRVWVNYAMRLTWGGEFIHAAPWSVDDQGYRNVSHGCVNMSWDNAAWLFGVAKVGDPITVRHTEVNVEDGNGWTSWNLSWPEYIKGSALPVPAALAAAGNPAPRPRASASGSAGAGGGSGTGAAGAGAGSASPNPANPVSSPVPSPSPVG
jgi:lipoprotein-anchoring transpeptidase ErfK/SrfK